MYCNYMLFYMLLELERFFFSENQQLIVRPWVKKWLI